MSADKGTCKGCGKAILWSTNNAGKAVPFDAKPTDVLMHPDAPAPIVAQAHVNHFVTCPNVDQFRKGNR